MMITTIGIDLAKSVFQIYGVDGNGKPLLKKQIKLSEMATFFSNVPSCLIGMEACGGAHYWARKLVDQGAHGQADGTTVSHALCKDE